MVLSNVFLPVFFVTHIKYYFYLLTFHRETLLGQLAVYIKQTRDSFLQKTGAGGKGIPKGQNVPEAVNNINWVQQLIAKVSFRFTLGLPASLQ